MNYAKMLLRYLRPQLNTYAAEALGIVLEDNDSETLRDAINLAYDMCSDEDCLGCTLFDAGTSLDFAEYADVSVVSQDICSALHRMSTAYIPIYVTGEIHREQYSVMDPAYYSALDCNLLDFDDGDHDFVIDHDTADLDIARTFLSDDFCKEMKGNGDSKYLAFRLTGIYDADKDDWIEMNCIGDLV